MERSCSRGHVWGQIWTVGRGKMEQKGMGRGTQHLAIVYKEEEGWWWSDHQNVQYTRGFCKRCSKGELNNRRVANKREAKNTLVMNKIGFRKYWFAPSLLGRQQVCSWAVAPFVTASFPQASKDASGPDMCSLIQGRIERFCACYWDDWCHSVVTAAHLNVGSFFSS